MPVIRRYFDHAATSRPKAPGVAEAMTRYLSEIGASPGRGAYDEALAADAIVRRCREALARVIGAASPGDVIFTSGATESLNLAVQGSLRPLLRTRSAVHAVATMIDHSAVLRSLHALKAEGLDLTIVRVTGEGLIDPAEVRRALRRETALIAMPHVSNVTGAVQSVREIGAMAKEHGVMLLVDGAQAAGHLPERVADLGADFYAFSAHKGLLGPPGCGALIVRSSLAPRLEPLRLGGTGGHAASARALEMPADVPVRFEAGTPNTVGLAGWLAALSWLLAQDRTALRAAEIALTRRLQDRLEGAAGITLHGPADPASRTGIAALTLRGWDPSTAEMVLASAHGILVRAGHHCAPLAAEALSLPAGGSIRLSLGWTTGEEDIDAAGAAVCALSDNPPAG